MACTHCNKIRDAVLHGKMALAAGLTVEKFRKDFGLTSKKLNDLGPELIVPESPKKSAKKQDD